ncbi:MAG TPA: phosphatidylcholine/phosphatidylserine synthase [Bacteroidetes bacterium]|nr:phosphatidylcholine/phosphatidylserine synthase [Bacteroidota bacterium]
MKKFSPLQKALAWATHTFTASGMVAGFFAILFIKDHQFVEAIYCLMAAFFIDGIDGTFARMFKVKEVLPRMDGQTIDYVVDFANYAIIPAFFIYEAGYDLNGEYIYLLPETWRWLAIALILIVSGLYYGLDGMVSPDMYFKGFPVLWNLAAYYMYFVLHWSPWINFGLIIFLSIAHFLPLKFVYPSRAVRFRIPNLIATALGVTINVSYLITIGSGMDIQWLRIAAIIMAIYLCLLTLYNSFWEPKFQSQHQ